MTSFRDWLYAWVSLNARIEYVAIIIQWNLSTMDKLGAQILSIVKRGCPLSEVRSRLNL